MRNIVILSKQYQRSKFIRMDSFSTKQLDQMAMKKQFALYLTGSSEAYESYKRTQQLKSLYPNDFHYYNDIFYYRHERNIEEIKKIKQLIEKGILKPDMLMYNTWNAFYPSYVMYHHFSVYSQILALFAKNQEVSQHLSRAKRMFDLGFFAKRVINTDFGKPVEDYEPTLNKNGQIQMASNYFFYDKHVSLYYHVACFMVKKENDRVLVFVKLRDAAGELLKDVTVKDFGERFAAQFLQIGYNYNKVKPFLAIKVSNDMKIQALNNASYFTEFNLSLLDLKKSLALAIKYTKMRQQFKTIPQSKAQRPIMTYQAVGSRLIDAFSRLVCFSELNKALFNNKQIIPFAAPLLDINHHLILESVIRLRECCGGFGYLQAAGHAGCIERLVLRASEAYVTDVPENAQILKRLHYYSSSDDMESYFGDLLTKESAFKQSQVFSVFINVCVNMRKSSQQMRKDIYLRHFMYQAAIQILKATQQFSKLPKDSVWFSVMYYACACYILQNSEFINWKFIDQHLTKEEYFRGLSEFKNMSLNKLIAMLPQIEEILEVNSLRNCIMGRENSNEFYDEVLEVSRNNLRNSEEFVEYVRKPILQFLAQNNAKL